MRLIRRDSPCQGGSTLRHAPFIVAILSLGLVGPVAQASWSAYGGAEPDTPLDIALGRMWRDPDTSPSGMRVYFDAIYLGSHGVNPNVGSFGSRMVTPDAMRFGALLGVWKDCNRDGYVGHMESVLVDYPLALLPDTSVCPVGTRFNDGVAVTEFIHFAPFASGNGVPRLMRDDTVRIWGDFGRPDVPAIPRPSCLADNQVPAGTLDSTGGMLLLVDCNLDYNIGRLITELDRDVLHAGIGFDGPGGHYRPDQDCDSALNVQLDLYGDSPCNRDDPGLFEAGSGKRIVNVWDCAAKDRDSQLADVRDPTAPPGRRGELSYIPDPQGGEHPLLNITDRDGTYGVPLGVLFTADEDAGVWLQFGSGAAPLAPSVNDTDGSLEDTRSHAANGLGSCADTPGADGFGEPILNSDYVFDPLRGKRTNDFTFRFQAPTQGSGGCANGVCYTRANTLWISEQTYGPPTGFPNGLVRRDNLAPVGGSHFTFYARVGAQPQTAGVSLPGAGDIAYGAEACGAARSGVLNGWDCDPLHWWSSDFGEDDEPGNARPGTLYQMRDTDCLDGSLGGGSGMFIGPAPFSSDPPCTPV